MVPVGGAIIASPSTLSSSSPSSQTQPQTFIADVSAMYPGRANASPITDLFITLLSMGEQGYRQLLTDRKRLFTLLQSRLSIVAEKYNERLLVCPHNHISIGLSLLRLDTDDTSYNGSQVTTSEDLCTSTSATNQEITTKGDISSHVDDASSLSIPVTQTVRSGLIDEDMCVLKTSQEQLTSSVKSPSKIKGRGASFLGSMLFQRHVSGCRVVSKTTTATTISDFKFTNWGAHCNSPDCSYLTAACAIGATEGDISSFLIKLEKCLQKIIKSK